MNEEDITKRLKAIRKWCDGLKVKDKDIKKAVWSSEQEGCLSNNNNSEGKIYLNKLLGNYIKSPETIQDESKLVKETIPEEGNVGQKNYLENEECYLTVTNITGLHKDTHVPEFGHQEKRSLHWKSGGDQELNLNNSVRNPKTREIWKRLGVIKEEDDKASIQRKVLYVDCGQGNDVKTQARCHKTVFCSTDMDNSVISSCSNSPPQGNNFNVGVRNKDQITEITEVQLHQAEWSPDFNVVSPGPHGDRMTHWRGWKHQQARQARISTEDFSEVLMTGTLTRRNRRHSRRRRNKARTGKINDTRHMEEEFEEELKCVAKKIENKKINRTNQEMEEKSGPFVTIGKEENTRQIFYLSNI